ncbi:MAG: glutamate--tRNA ligase [Holosporales bacterium]|jgi:glutamyl-tRNA synthetase|nr:glutamate--tRNA ligase [Holosporales bacterium]
MFPRVRFAPSPTGVLHIGSVRTALFNWLYARHNGGKFLLRIEDTDKVRSTEQNTKLIFEILEWLGIDWDEEPVIQSTRLTRHREVAETMVEEGTAYRCCCSPEELAAKKEKALSNGKPYKYDGTCRDRNITNLQSVIRLKSKLDGNTKVTDLVQGSVVVENSQLDDIVLLRSDGTPTYMLSVVVDDHDMDITHIIRGDDHLTNTFKQIQIYEACGWTTPSFAHIPLIYGPDGAKLSKRHGAASAVDYRELGYLPETISNYLLRLGWSHGNDEIISRAEAIEWFDLKNIGKSPSRFDMKKLQNLNAHYIRQRDNASLLSYMLPFLKEQISEAEEKRLLRGMDDLKARAKTVVDLAEATTVYVEAPTHYDDACSKYATDIHIALLHDVVSVLDGISGSVTEEQIAQSIKELAEQQGVKLIEIAQAMRAALCGRLVSPSVFQIIEIIGIKETVNRINSFMAYTNCK